MQERDLLQIPKDLPVPVDDGAAAHLVGMNVPSGLALRSTQGGTVDLASLKGRTVVYAYPRTGVPGSPLISGWDHIPGARGCTPESCSFRDHHAEIKAHNASVFGLSTQDTAYQSEVAGRLRLPFALLSDERLVLTNALRLPTFEAAGLTLLKRATLVIRDGAIEHVFYPIFPPDTHAQEVLAWLKTHRV